MTEKSFDIKGRGMEDAETHESVSAFLEEEREKAGEKIEGELEKSLEEKEYIQDVTDYLNEELKELGIKKDFKFSPDQMHFLSKRDFEKRFPEGKIGANSAIMENKIFFNKTVYGGHKVAFLLALAHEITHLASQAKFYANTETAKVALRGSGIAVQNRPKKHEHFRGFNEAITDRVVTDVLKKHENEVIDKFKLTEEDFGKSKMRYDGYQRILRAVTNGISKEKNEPEKESWRRIKKSFFTGRISNLKEVDEVFGKGSLRLLSSLGSIGQTKDLGFPEINKKVLKYFATEDIGERQGIAEEVLTEEEFKRYKSHRDFKYKE